MLVVRCCLMERQVTYHELLYLKGDEIAIGYLHKDEYDDQRDCKKDCVTVH